MDQMDEQIDSSQVAQGNKGMIEWSASEYVEHDKSPLWYAVLGVVSLALAAFAVFVIKQYTFAALIAVMVVAIVIWARRPAQEMFYQLNPEAISINGKLFSLSDFRAFGIVQDGALYYATLLPNKRFSPGVNVYFPHELGEQIVDILGSRLAMETIKPDFVDKLMNKLNF